MQPWTRTVLSCSCVLRVHAKSWICSSHQQANHVGYQFVVTQTLHAVAENMPQELIWHHALVETGVALLSLMLRAGQGLWANDFTPTGLGQGFPWQFFFPSIYTSLLVKFSGLFWHCANPQLMLDQLCREWKPLLWNSCAHYLLSNIAESTCYFFLNSDASKCMLPM